MSIAKKEEVNVKFPYGIPADGDVKLCLDIGRLVLLPYSGEGDEGLQQDLLWALLFPNEGLRAPEAVQPQRLLYLFREQPEWLQSVNSSNQVKAVASWSPTTPWKR